MLCSPTLFILFALLTLQISASPAPVLALHDRRTDPVFPDSPASCPICAKDYGSINSCAQAAPVLANVSMIIFNPGAFVDVIKCACTDTFQAVFPQCVDCFIQTGQEDILNSSSLPSVVDGMRKICAFGSALLGNVSEVNGATPTPSSTSGGVLKCYRQLSPEAIIISLFAFALSLCSLGLS